MTDQPKIKILDCPELRAILYRLVSDTEQVVLANWAIACARRILDLQTDEPFDIKVVEKGFATNKRWQENKASVHEVRQAGFKIHEAARACSTEIARNMLRTAGQAVAVGHMREHAMVCSDYAIKTIQLWSGNDADRIAAERQWQITALNNLQEDQTDTRVER